MLALLIGLPFSKAVASLAVVGLLLGALWKIRQFRHANQEYVFYTPVIIFIVLTVSLLYSTNFSSGWDHLYRQNPMLLFPFIILTDRLLFSNRLTTYFRYFVYAVAVVCLITLFFYFIPSSLAEVITERLSFLKPYQAPEIQDAFGAYSPFLDRLHFGYMIGIACLVQLWLIFKYSFTWMQGLVFLTLGATMLILGARGAQIGLLLAVSVWTIWWTWSYLQFYSPNRYMSGLFISLSLILLLIVPYLAYQYLPAVQTRYNQLIWEVQTFYDGTYLRFSYTHFTSLRRILSWQSMWEIVMQQPILGVGIGDYNDTLKSIYLEKHADFPPNTHQQFLFYWGAAGLAGFLAFCMSFVVFLIHSLRINSLPSKVLGVCFFTFFFVVFLLDTPLLYQAGSMSFWLFYLLLSLLMSKHTT